MNRIEWKKKAVRQLRKLPKQVQAQVVGKVSTLEDLATAANVTSLSNHSFDYRLRVGNYRVLFNHNATIEIVSIEEVKKRNERTY